MYKALIITSYNSDCSALRGTTDQASCVQVDVCSIEEVDEIARLPYAVPASAGTRINMNGLLESMWSQMALVRVYTKKVRLLWALRAYC